MHPDPTADLLTLTYRPDLGIFVGRWGCQPAVEALPAVYRELKQQALAAGCHYWLQDIRRRAFNDPQTTQWLLTDFFPEMSRLLGGRLAVAYLVGPALMEAIVNGPGFREPGAFDNQPYVVAFFGDEGQAIAWLNQQRLGSR
ncbi:hypothetical protein [Hymenobacter persicinus]|uniref:STAS/SEC14 domain-containing protein n=1 Tax=Hymenobacter persicinus TaxID=2025506 RepID=A0A4Q5LEU0_9BACT|nr:hypothetical protein [Hymenobacter persicinus]RYU81031.1 hypothetical protein EWM57_07260 [Hymenobacter persicinus]